MTKVPPNMERVIPAATAGILLRGAAAKLPAIAGATLLTFAGLTALTFAGMTLVAFGSQRERTGEPTND